MNVRVPTVTLIGPRQAPSQCTDKETEAQSKDAPCPGSQALTQHMPLVAGPTGSLRIHPNTGLSCPSGGHRGSSVGGSTKGSPKAMQVPLFYQHPNSGPTLDPAYSLASCRLVSRSCVVWRSWAPSEAIRK